MHIRIFDVAFDEDFRDKLHKGVDQILDEAYLSNHKFVRDFESSFSNFHGKGVFSTAVTSGTTALEAAFRSIGVSGKKIIIPSNTFIATAVAAKAAGAEFVLADIENDFFGICPKDLEKIINDIGVQNIGCVCAVHIGGHISDHFLKVKKICEAYKLHLVEDSAHTIGARLNGSLSGTLGDYGCFSLYLTKVMTTGEGGVVITNTEKNYQSLQSIRRFGMRLENSIMHHRDGMNMKMTEFQGLFGILELERLESRIQRRREIAKFYQENIDETKYRVIKDSEISIGSYYKQVLIPLSLDRAYIEKKLYEKELPLTGGVYYIPIHQQDYFKDQFAASSFPVTDEFARKHICPPCYPELKDDDVFKMIEALNEL